MTFLKKDEVNRSNIIIMDVDETLFPFTEAYCALLRTKGYDVDTLAALERRQYSLDEWLTQQGFGNETHCKGGMLCNHPIYVGEYAEVFPYMQKILREFNDLQNSSPVQIHFVTHAVAVGSKFEAHKLAVVAAAMKLYAPDVEAKYHSVPIEMPKDEFIGKHIGDRIDLMFDDSLNNIARMIASDHIHVNSYYIPLMHHNVFYPETVDGLARMKKSKMRHCAVEAPNYLTAEQLHDTLQMRITEIQASA